MMENKLKREWHYFLLTDYEEEEQFLRQKHKNGERLVKVSLPGFYYFEKCEPEDVVYRLDFCPKPEKERENYQQMFVDYGWEYIQDLNEYSYFRKPAKDAIEEDMEIFSDNESRLVMLKNIFQKRMLPIMAIFLLLGVPQIVRVLSGEFIGTAGLIVSIMWILITIMYAKIFIHCGIGFYKLKKKYS